MKENGSLLKGLVIAISLSFHAEERDFIAFLPNPNNFSGGLLFNWLNWYYKVYSQSFAYAKASAMVQNTIE